jgi:hypothetical protein
MAENEFRVRPVTRYIVTHFQSEELPDGSCSGGSRSYGEFDNLAAAEAVGLALHRATDGSTFQTLANSPLREDDSIAWSDAPIDRTVPAMSPNPLPSV